MKFVQVMPLSKIDQKLSSNVLIFSVQRVVNILSSSFATFATNGETTFYIMSVFWKNVFYLEKINLKVLASTTDGASPYRKCFKTLKLLDGNIGTDVAYQTESNHAQENHFFFQTLYI